MNGARRGWMLLAVLVAMMVASGNAVMAQISTTTVQDTVYSANGTPATGSVVVSWNAFTTAGGQAVPAGSTSATIGAGGLLTMTLAPNAGSTPMGAYYTAVFHLGDGTTSREYWVVPVTVPGGGVATLGAIKNSVLPASVAMQTVSKQYVDNAIAAAALGAPLDASPYVAKAGDTMTGPLGLPADPVNTNQAADKHYVDTNVAAVAAGLGQKVSLLPSATQVVAQPVGTQLDVNLLNGELYASQYVGGQGSNGIANALASADCAAGCKVVVEPTYTGTDASNAALVGISAAGTAIVDQRGGAQTLLGVNPMALNMTVGAAQSITQIATQTVPQLEVLRPGTSSASSRTLSLNMQALTGGSNQIAPGAPYGKSTYGTLAMTGTYDTAGQHVQMGNTLYCHGVGDCLAGGQFLYSSGGYRDAADEGTHPFDLFVSEDTAVFVGTCSTGCSTGATSVKMAATLGGGSQGDGRFVIDTNPAKVMTAGTLTGGGKTGNATSYGTASFTGTSFPVSLFLSTAQAASSQAANIAPGTVTLAIATSGVVAGFGTSTAALPSSGVACVTDQEGSGQPTPYYEMANYTVVDATHIRLTLNKVHASGATIAVGGLCGYGLEQTADTTGGIRQLFPVIGSYDATDLYYADGMTPSVGRGNAPTSPSGYMNVALTVTGISRTANVVTVTTTGTTPGDLNGLSLTVGGVADSSYNGTFVVTTTAANTFTYANTGANSTSSGGTATLLTGGYVLYPMAEVLSVFNAANGQVDGTMTLAANTVPWAAGDAVEEPHYYQQRTYADTEFITQYVPRPQQYTGAGKMYQGTVGPGLRGWMVTNGAPASQYLGAGGTHNVPDYAYVVAGPWNRDFDVQAGNQAVIWAHCNLNGCNRWDSTYALFQLDSAAGSGRDYLNYAPQSSIATWLLGGATYSFSPTSFTAGTINVGTLNATTITGGVSGAAITSGTVSAARLPALGPSGSTHAAGIVPDPGATAGATRYLREDGTWSIPAGGGGGSGTVTSFAAGTWPAWLTPTVTSATITPTLTVAASAIPNASLANSATTVNGQSCALGASCTITVGTSAFSSLTGGSNTTAAMVVGTGASLSASGTGTVAATSVPFTGVTGTATVAQLPVGIPNANLANSGTTVNGVVCGLGATCTITAPPATEIKYSPAAVCDGGTAFASGVTRYDNQQPQAGCVLPASSTAAYLAFNAGVTLPQYASATIATPTFWTGTSLYLKFAGTAATGTVGWIVDTACTNDGQVISTAVFGTATTVSTTVSSTVGASVTTLVFANAGVPGTNGCAAGTTVPGSLLTYRIHRSSSDTQLGNANLLGVVLVTGRSQ